MNNDGEKSQIKSFEEGLIPISKSHVEQILNYLI